MGSFEYHQTSFSYIDNDNREERFVGVPEQGGTDTISTDPLAPGSIYTASVDDQGFRVMAQFLGGANQESAKKTHLRLRPV